MKRNCSPRTGTCDFLPPVLRNETTNKINALRNSGSHRPEFQLFDSIAPLVWQYLCEQHALFVCSKEFATVVQSAEQAGNTQTHIAELTAQRNATANSRVPPLIGFAKYRIRGSQNPPMPEQRQRSRPRSEPPGPRR